MICTAEGGTEVSDSSGTMTRNRLNEIVIYTDGACLGNPGRGGYAAVVLGSNARYALSGGAERTTNNRMELMAAIVALEGLQQSGQPVVVCSDSTYLVNGVRLGWAANWLRQENCPGRCSSGRPNLDLWRRLLGAVALHRYVRFEHVRGHAGIPENEECDCLANEAAHRRDLPPDEGYLAFLSSASSVQPAPWFTALAQPKAPGRRWGGGHP